MFTLNGNGATCFSTAEDDENEPRQAKRGKSCHGKEKKGIRLPPGLIPFVPIPLDFLNIPPKARPFSCLRSEERRCLCFCSAA